MTTTETICVWRDTTTQPGEPSWIVSRDHLDSLGRAEMTRTLEVCATESEAHARGQEIAAELALPYLRHD